MIGRLLGFVTNFAGGWQKWAVIGGLFAGLLLYVGWLKWDIATYQVTVATQAAAINEAERVNKVAAAAIESLEKDRVKREAVLSKTHKEAIRNAERANALAKEIERVPQVENCVIGPTVRGLIERMFDWPNTHPDGTEGGQTGSSDRTAVVPKRAR